MQDKMHKRVDIRRMDEHFSRMIDDFCYSTHLFQEIGLITNFKPTREIEQDKDVQEAFSTLITKLEKEIKNFQYIDKIKKIIAFIKKYGVTTLSESEQGYGIMGLVADDTNRYEVLITVNNDIITIQTTNTVGQKQLVTNLVIDLLHQENIIQTTEELQLNYREYDLNQKTFRDTQSLNITQTINKSNKVQTDKRTTSKKVEVVNDPKNPNNNGRIMSFHKEERLKMRCKNESTIANIERTTFAESSSDGEFTPVERTTYFISNNTSNEQTRLESDTTRFYFKKEELDSVLASTEEVLARLKEHDSKVVLSLFQKPEN